MTKIHRQPKQPKPARVTLAEVRGMAWDLGSPLNLSRVKTLYLPPKVWSAWVSLDRGRFIHAEHPSRSAALRIMHAALVAMRKEQGK